MIIWKNGLFRISFGLLKKQTIPVGLFRDLNVKIGLSAPIFITKKNHEGGSVIGRTILYL